MSHRRLRHLPFSLGSGTTGAKLVLYAPAMRGYADNDPVGTWSDLSSNANNATSTGTNRPTYKTAIQGGMPVLRFNGTPNRLDCATSCFSGANARTVIGCYKPLNSSGTFNYPICGQSGSTGSLSNTGTWFQIQARTQIVVGDPYLACYSNDLGNGATTPDANAKVASASYNGTTAFLYKNGDLKASGAKTLNTNLVVFRIGFDGETNFNNFANADIFSVIVYTSASSEMRQRIQQSNGFTFRIATR